MPLEIGGRADKMGNRYEIRCIIYEMLKIFQEINYSIVIEALGDDEVGTDILITDVAGKREHQQCKVRNASKESWSIADLKSRNILNNWKKQLERDGDREVSLVSAVGCSYIVDLHNRAQNTSGNPEEFYKYQIENGSKEFQNAYIEFCRGMGLNNNETMDVAKSIDFLKRINFKQISEYILKDIISQNIEHLFATAKESVYSALVELVIDSNIYGKEITFRDLSRHLEKRDIHMRMLDRDRRILPQIKLVNQEYRRSFKPLKEGLISRNEFEKCIDAIKNEQSLVISGNAGYGKSGCTEAILDYCEKTSIPYIAIKLDRRIPHGNSEIWGCKLGFSSSIVYAMDAIAKNKTAVIVLDQLDALRWTQANSYEALSVCMEMIKQVRYLNYKRTKKIVIVFVCREYDLRNDNNIKSLFEKENDGIPNVEWKNIIIKDFDKTIVKKIVGKKYDKLTIKTRHLLQVPSNLYIWQHLDETETCDDCMTASHLIDNWYEQICKKSSSAGVDEKVVRDTVDTIKDVLDKIGRLYVPKGILNVDERGIDYLVSTELLIRDGSNIGFVHQSILDYFISERMTRQFLEENKIEPIVGEMNRQTPSKRYQIQMFLRNLLEYDSGYFLSAGTQLTKSLQVRFYIKYVFYEMLGQISKPDRTIVEYIKQECKNCNDYFIDNVVCGQHVYITALRESGILELWISDDNRKHRVFSLLASVSQNLDSQDIAFIKKHLFVNKEDDNQFRRCFFHNITEESDELFELRMLVYNRYPKWSQELYIDVNAMMKCCQSRIIRLISFWLKYKIISKRNIVYKYEEALMRINGSDSLLESMFILNELIPYVPVQDARTLYLSDWTNNPFKRNSLERTVVELLKKANVEIIAKDAECFWDCYYPYMGKGYAVFNELILHGLQFLSKSYSDKVIEYLTGDFDKKMIDCTSGADDRLELAKKVIRVHTKYCSDERLKLFLEAIEMYVSPQSVEWYKRRIEHNQKKGCGHVYWSFWGDFQYNILQSIMYERLAPRYRSLLNVLDRKFQGKAHRYFFGSGSMGGVKSPVAGKKIGKKQWLQIITNRKIPDENHASWKETDHGFIESSVSAFAEDFREVVKDDPIEMIKMVIENKENIMPVYVDEMFLGAKCSKCFEVIEKNLWEQMFHEFPSGMKGHRALYFCDIIKEADIYDWSREQIDKLKEIIVCYEEGETIKDYRVSNCEDLINKSLSCVKGHAIRAIGHLLWENQTLFAEFKDIIDKLVTDAEASVRFSCFYALWPIYNIDREWAEKRILFLYESDVRMACYPNTGSMFFRLYSKYKQRILQVIRRCFAAKDERLMEIGGYTICEFYIKYNEFEDIILNMEQMNDIQLNAILAVAVAYLKFDEYRNIGKDIILKCINEYSANAGSPLNKLFYENLVNVEHDSEFLKEIMKSKVGRGMVHSFVRFLEQKACSVKEYAEVIIALCENILNASFEERESQIGMERYISKLIIALYDETAHSNYELDKDIADKCLGLWDVMFEKQIGQVRDLSRQLMER